MSENEPINSRPCLSVVIVNYRCWEKLDGCLNALTQPSDLINLQVIVVDNDSADGKLTEFSNLHPTVTFVENGGNWGFASGCNRGAAEATASTLLFLNPDTVAQPEALAELLAIKMSNPDIGLLSCKQIDGNGNNQRAFGDFQRFWTTFGITRAVVQHLFPNKYPSARRELSELTDCDWISGSVVMISREHLDALGGWDDGYWMYSEDVDLCKRASAHSLRVCYEPSVTITHLHGGASRGSKEIKALTKSEVIISKHVFIDKHSAGINRPLQHGLVLFQRVLPITLTATLSLPLTLVGKTSGAQRKLQHLSRYYQRWMKTGDVLSPRSRKTNTKPGNKA